MDYQELHQRYGSHIAKRVQAELDITEFGHIELETLSAYLETRAGTAQKKYQMERGDPFSKKEAASGEESINHLYQLWRDADELSSLVTVAEDVSNMRSRVSAR